MSDQLTHEVRENLAIRNLIITRMDGIREGYRVDSLSPGINLVHGPNGIGKSRTAQALQALIWPGSSSDRASIIGNLKVAADAWNVELESGRTAYQKNSASVPGFPFALPPDSHRDRYLLTLQDLLRVENRDFALHIQREASGGYDLERVRTAMSIPDATKKYRPSQSEKHLIEIQKRIRDLKQQEEQLRDQEASLDQLRVQHQNAVAAEKRLGELDAARTYRDACEHLERASVALEMFPRPVTRMFGDELERAEKLVRNLDENREALRTSSALAATLEKEILDTGLPADIPSISVLSVLEQRLERVRRLDQEIEQADIARARHVDKLTRARNRLKRDLTEEQMVSLDPAGFRDLADLSLKWQEVSNRLQNEADLASWLGTATEWDRESLKSGIELLSRYLRTQSTATTSSRKRLVVASLIAAAIIIILSAVLLATSLSQYSLLLALAALPLLWLGFTMNSDPAETELKQIRSQYSTLGLEEPVAWGPDEVFNRMRQTQEKVAKADLDHERTLRWDNLEERRQQLARDLQGVEEKRAAYTAKYGLHLTEDIPQNLIAMADALEEWNQEKSRLTDVESEKAARESSRTSILGTIQAELRSLGTDMEVHDAINAHAAIKELQRRITTAERASSELGHTRRRIDQELVPRIREDEERLSGIFNELGLAPNDLTGLKNLCDQIQPYQEARNAVNTAEITVATLRSKLRQGIGDENLDWDALEILVASHTGLAGQRDTLQAEISRIETEIARARHQTRLEAEIASETAALETLSDARLRDYASVADRLVYDLVQNRNREINRPAVFRNADSLFVSFTNGAYRLDLDEAKSEFTAVESDTGRSVTLDKLSSGTRVQLLLAVRLAFIETSENGLQLPLIMDETLGNTDDIRAKAIIDATIEIARRGRQVMYFTAQHDEIGKWSSALDSLGDSLEWNVFDLAAIRLKAAAKPVPAYAWSYSAFTTVSIPDGTDWNSLREHLGVPAIDIQATSVTEVDLWYLIPEASTLVELRKRGIQRWGQYLNLHHGNHLRGIWSERGHDKALARARAFEQFCTAWREGRPARLTADDLRESGLISNHFWDRVVACAHQYNWDGTALIRALENREISGFHRAVIESLSEWLTDNGFITQTQPLDDEVIRARVISSVNDAIEREIIDIHEIDELIRHLVGQPVPEKQAS